MKFTATAVLLALLLSACEPANKTSLVVEAADYTPIGEALKFIALAAIGCVVLKCLTSIFNREQ